MNTHTIPQSEAALASEEARKTLSGPCDTCAFGLKGGAAEEVNNRVKGMICAYGASVFWCHHGRDGTEYDWRGSKLGPMLLAPQNRKPCAGWQDYVSRLKRAGFFANADYLTIRKCIARRALKLLERFTDDQTPVDEKEFTRVEFDRCMRFITAKDIGPLEIPLLSDFTFAAIPAPVPEPLRPNSTPKTSGGSQ
jgi:hypothetical protein